MISQNLRDDLYSYWPWIRRNAGASWIFGLSCTVIITLLTPQTPGMIVLMAFGFPLVLFLCCLGVKRREPRFRYVIRYDTFKDWTTATDYAYKVSRRAIEWESSPYAIYFVRLEDRVLVRMRV